MTLPSETALQIRVTPAEKAAFRRAAVAVGLTLSAWIRMVARERAIKILVEAGEIVDFASVPREKARKHGMPEIASRENIDARGLHERERSAADVQHLPGAPQSTEPAELREVPRRVHARVAQDSPADTAPAREGERTSGSANGGEARSYSTPAMCGVRGSQEREAPSRLQQAARRDLAMPPVPHEDSSDEKDRVEVDPPPFADEE